MSMLSIMKLMAQGGFVGTTEGQHFIAGFIDDVDNGRQVPWETLERLADCLRPLADIEDKRTVQIKMNELAHSLGVASKQGKQLSAEREANNLARSLVSYFQKIEQYKAEGLCDGKAELEARRWYCEQEGIKDQAARNRIKEHGETWWQIRKDFLRWHEELSETEG